MKISPFNLGQFCRELACGIDTQDEVFTAWGITQEDYDNLCHSELFQKEFLAAINEIRDLGPNSAYIMKCRGVAEATLENVVGIIRNDRVDPAVRVNAYKLISDLGRLAAPKSENSGSSGPSVVFHFGAGIKGIPETLTLQPAIECTPTTTPEPTTLPPP